MICRKTKTLAMASWAVVPSRAVRWQTRVRPWLCVVGACFGATAGGASPLTPDLPVPNLVAQSEVVPMISAFREARIQVRGELERIGEASAKELVDQLARDDAFAMAAGSAGANDLAATARRVAQVELWRAVLFAGESQAPSPHDSLKQWAAFTERDTLAWCAAILTAADDEEAAKKIVAYTNVPPDAVRVVSRILKADDAARDQLIVDLGRALGDAPKDPAIAMAVDIILRRGVGAAAARADLDVAARTVADDTVAPLRTTLAQRLKADRTESMKAILGRAGIPVTGVTPDGADFDQQALLGKDVVVVFWRPASAACLSELPRLRQAYDELRAKEVEFVMVHTNCVGREVNDFVSRHPKLGWIQLTDAQSVRKGASHPLAAAVGLTASDVPAIMLIDSNGIVQALDAGLDVTGLVERCRARAENR